MYGKSGIVDLSSQKREFFLISISPGIESLLSFPTLELSVLTGFGKSRQPGGSRGVPYNPKPSGSGGSGSGVGSTGRGRGFTFKRR